VNDSIDQSAVKARKTIVFLEFFRVYAVIAVFISHKFPEWALISLDEHRPVQHLIEIVYNAFMPILTNGQGGVIIFFFISGYVIAQKIEQESTIEFLVKRIFRIYPLYIVAVICVTFISPDRVIHWHRLWPKFTLLGDLNGVSFGLAVEWTLRIEVEFYLLAALLTLVGTFRHRDRLVLLLINAATVICVIMPPFPNWSPNTLGLFNQFFPFLMVGMGLYYYERKRAAFWMILPIIVLALSEMSAGGMALFMFFTFFLVMILRGEMRNYSWINRLSCITYSAYLFHLWLYDYLLREFTLIRFPLPELTAVIGLILCCYLVHFLVERPFIRLGRHVSIWADNVCNHGVRAVRRSLAKA
jgi:peptidoglycan/LPS O-acetylase OafA/YrhL